MALYVTFILIIGGMGTTIGPMVGVTLIIFLYDILFRNHGLDAYIMLLGVLAVDSLFMYWVFFRLLPGAKPKAIGGPVSASQPADQLQTEFQT
jgi:ABC-type branched-subunit amino acid transport system permease subunit